MISEHELLASYRPWLRTTARRALNGRPGSEDLAQEMWIAMWRALADQTVAPQDFWLKRQALLRMKTCLRDWHDPMKHRQHVFTHDVTEVADLPAELGTVELAYHHGEIHAALDRLSPREREYVALRFWGGLNYPELAEHFGYRPTNLWRTARPKLAEALEHLAVAS